MDNYGKWISVKDRLPDKSGMYIVYCDWGYMDSAEYSARKKLFNSADGDDGKYAFKDVAYWMPMPEPPEDDEPNAG